MAPAAASSRWPLGGIAIGVGVGAALASLIWLSTGAPTEPAERPVLVEPPTSDARPACPPAPTCPPVLACPPERLAGTDTEGSLPETTEPISPVEGLARTYEPGLPVQVALSDAMSSARLDASFDVDCSVRPCLAVLAGPVPTEQQRSAVIEHLVETHPGLHLNSTTILREGGQVTWVLELAAEEPTPEERALVGVRVEGLLP